MKYAEILIGVSEFDLEDEIVVKGVGVLAGNNGEFSKQSTSYLAAQVMESFTR